MDQTVFVSAPDRKCIHRVKKRSDLEPPKETSSTEPQFLSVSQILFEHTCAHVLVNCPVCTKIAVFRGALRVHWLLTATTSAKRSRGWSASGMAADRAVADGRSGDGAAEAHGRKTKREGAPLSPYFAGQGL